ncbi:MAG: HEAT repeat domain-containing protein [Thermoguttaceae bacterium]
MSLFYSLFRSPLSLIIPLTGICVLLLLLYLNWSSEQFADQLAQKMEQVPEDDVKVFAEQLGSLGKPGISRLVHALTSQRRSVVFAARDVLEKNFQQWSNLPPNNSAPLHLQLSRSLSEELDSFRPTSQLLAVSWSQRILRHMLKSEGEKYPNQSKIAEYCQRILTKTEGERTVLAEPRLLDEMHIVASGGEPKKLLPVELSSRTTQLAKRQNGLQNEVEQERENELEFYDPYSSPRADLLYVLYRSRATSQPVERERPDSSPFEEATTGETMIAGNLTDLNLRELPTAGFPSPTLSQPTQRIGSKYEDLAQPQSSRDLRSMSDDSNASNDLIQGVNSSSGLEEKLPQLPPYLENVKESYSDVQRPIEETSLGRIDQDAIPNLPTVDLMRLLQHPNKAIAALAEQQLRKREYYQDAHIALALRLYNPKPELRKEILELLPRIPSVQPIPWLVELLRDPNPDVRFATLSYLATAKDRQLVQLMIDRAKKDDDPRMNVLVEKLERLSSLRQQEDLR